MQAIAPSGSIAITEHTRRLVEGYFQLKPRGPTRVKGLSEPVEVYEVTGLGPLRTRLQRAAARGLTKFVGRDREIDVLKHAAAQAQAGHGQVVGVMADPGVGKSRLFYEFKAISQSGWIVLEAFSLSHGKASAYLPVLELLSEYFEISRDDDERKRRERVLGKCLGLTASSKIPCCTCTRCRVSRTPLIRWRKWTSRSGGGAPWMRSNGSCCGRASISR
jgi:hypothetical protein